MEKALYQQMVAQVGGIDRVRLIVTASAGHYYLFTKDHVGHGRYVIVEEGEDWLRLVDVVRGMVAILSYEEIELIFGQATETEIEYANDIREAVLNDKPIPPAPPGL